MKSVRTQARQVREIANQLKSYNGIDQRVKVLVYRPVADQVIQIAVNATGSLWEPKYV